ncbi:MAG: hypothetical protein Q8R05_03035 [Candidatus Omnitrophota bacterium]|nr:hypothetical protein [Candidatus Omnitrophota bacterium]
MRSIEFIAKAGKRLEIQEVDSNQNVFICPAIDLEEHPYFGGRAVRQYKVKIEYDVAPITEV